MEPLWTEAVLLISAGEADHKFLLSVTGIGNMLHCHSIAEAQHWLGAFPIVLCDESLPDGDWKTVLSMLRACQRLVVMSRVADEVLWSEVLNRGGYDLLPKPLAIGEARWVLQSALNTLVAPGATGATANEWRCT